MLKSLTPEKVFPSFLGLAIVCAIAGFVFSISTGREIAIRSWEVVRQGMQSATNEGDLEKAEKLARQSVDLAKGIDGNDFRVSISLSDLADILLSEKKNKEAFDAYKKASEVEKAQSSDTANGAKIFSNSHLGHIFYQMGRTANILDNPKDGARYLKKSAVAFESIRKNEKKKKDLFIGQELVRTLIAQAETAGLLDQPDERLRYYRKALRLCGECYYPAQEVDHIRKEFAGLSAIAGIPVETACGESTWANLMEQAAAAQKAGLNGEYERLLQESIRGCEGDNSRQFLALISLRKLAKNYVYYHNYDKGADACRKGLAIWREMGTNSGGDSAADALYGYLLRCTKDPRERLNLTNSQLELRISLYGSDDFHIAETSTRVAVLAYILGDKVTMKLAMDRAYNIYTHARLKRRGTGLDMIDLGNLFFDTGDYKRAEAIYQRAYKIWSLSPGKHIALKVDVLNRLHAVYSKLNLTEQMEQVDRDRRQLESSGTTP